MPIPETITIENNPELTGMARLDRNIVYSQRTGQTLTLISPWKDEHAAPKKRPLIVFLQGSAWTSPDLDYEIPQLSRYAQKGYVVATITHRDSTRGHAFPAYLEDSKTAIRFLKANAERFDIDPERAAFFGTSSGGNTALLVGLTADDPRYKTGEYAEYSDGVKTVIACFPPTDIPALMAGAGPLGNGEEMEQNPIFLGLMGAQDPRQVARAMSPIHEIRKGAAYPPFLLAHGDADGLVDYSQSERMFEALRAAGHRAHLIRVTKAPHEGSFWSGALHELMYEFLTETL